MNDKEKDSLVSKEVQHKVQQVNLKNVMSDCYLDYAVSVIVSRAIPDLRDGLKPVQRRILYSMYRAKNFYNKPHIKSARISGTVTANYHPHGDEAVYDTMVRLAQDFSMRLPLIDGQGNFGSLDRDPAAAKRYTEVRLTKASEKLLQDLEYSAVDFVPNYDNKTTEPTVLSVPFPNVLVNGASGIAVGMATNIPPHNIGEVIDATLKLLEDPETSLDDLGNIVLGPDFPTGGLIWGQEGLKQILHTGHGSVKLRSNYRLETINKREAIVFTDVPYQINKAQIVETIADRVREKRITHIHALRDESNIQGVRIVLELNKGAVPEVIVNQLYKLTPLEVSFNVYMLMLYQNKPVLMNIKKILLCFLEFRSQVILRRLRYLLNKAREQAFSLIGLLVAIANLDEFVRIIRSSANPETARKELLSRPWSVTNYLTYFHLISDPRVVIEGDKCYLAPEQVTSILDMRLQRLTALGVDEIFSSLISLKKDMEYYLKCISSKQEIDNIIKEELLESRALFSTPRLTKISTEDLNGKIEDLIPNDLVVITTTHLGYIKRVGLDNYRLQKRGGKGRIGMHTKNEDFVINVLTGYMHDTLLCFSSLGRVYQLRVHLLPESAINGQGRPIQNLINLQKNENITNILVVKANIKEYKESSSCLFFVTKKGKVRRNSIQDFYNVRSNGKIAFPLIDHDHLVSVSMFQENQHVFLFSHRGRCVRFPVAEVRVFVGRSSLGVRGMRLAGNDHIIGIACLKVYEYTTEQCQMYLKSKRDKSQDQNMDPELFKRMAEQEEYILSITANGYGKRTSCYEYRITKRGGKGVINIVTSSRNGKVIFSAATKNDEHLVMITRQGQIIRLLANKVRISGRATQGVRLFKIDSKDEIVSVDYEKVALEAPENNLPEDATDTLSTADDSSLSPDDKPSTDSDDLYDENDDQSDDFPDDDDDSDYEDDDDDDDFSDDDDDDDSDYDEDDDDDNLPDDDRKI